MNVDLFAGNPSVKWYDCSLIMKTHGTFTDITEPFKYFISAATLVSLNLPEAGKKRHIDTSFPLDVGWVVFSFCIWLSSSFNGIA